MAVLALATALAVAAPAMAARHHATAARHHYRTTSLPTGLTDPSKDAALIVDGATGKVLYARNAEAERHPASLTKMMTLYLLFDALKKGQLTLSSTLTFSSHAASQQATNLHLGAGDTITVDTAIRAIVVRSANDVAVAIAEALGGTESHFAEMMTAKARAIGMRDTFFHNASGLPDPLQITTAGDLAILARHLAYDDPQYFHYFATRDFAYRGVHYVGHDNLLGRYDGADGMKTGYTNASGFNLVSSVVRGRTHIIGVVMGGRTAHRRDTEMMQLLDNTFDSIDKNPTLVAHVDIPWQTVAMNSPSLPGLLTASTFPQPGTSVPLPDARGSFDNADEDTAETLSDQEDAANDIAAAPAPPAAAAPAIATPPRVAAAVATPMPRPKPIVVASYQPQTPQQAIAKPPIPKPSLRPEIGEGDISANYSSVGIHDWTIQIGAFTDLNLARTQLAAYAEKSMDVLGQAQRIVVPFQSIDGHLLYRARFGPFLEREARQVCQRLTERGQTCFAAISTR